MSTICFADQLDCSGYFGVQVPVPGISLDKHHMCKIFKPNVTITLLIMTLEAFHCVIYMRNKHFE